MAEYPTTSPTFVKRDLPDNSDLYDASESSLNLMGGAAEDGGDVDAKPAKEDSDGSITLDISAKSNNSNYNNNRNKNNNSIKNNNFIKNNNRSVSFATGTSFDGSFKKETSSSHPPQQSRVAMMKARLNASFTKTTNFDDSLNASWGGALSLDDMSSSSDDSDDSEGSMGDFANLDGSKNRSLNSSSDFRAKAQESMSFNASFMNLGGDIEVKKNTVNSRGSLFLIDDDRFAQTKVVQSRQRKAAVVMQRFFRRCLAILRIYSEEVKYFQDEKVDIEQRRVDELARYKEFIEEEKQRVKLELDQEFDPIKMSPEEWQEFQEEQARTKEEIQQLKEDNFELKNQCKELERENAQLAIKDPVKEQELRKIEQEVKKLGRDKSLWVGINGNLMDAIAGAERKITFLTEKRQKKRDERKRYEKCISNIVALIEEKQSRAAPDLVKKVSKMKKKQDKRMKKIKAKTIQETQLRKHGRDEQLEHLHEEHEEEEEELEKAAPSSATKLEDIIPLEPEENESSTPDDPAAKKDQTEKKKKKHKDKKKDKDKRKSSKSKEDTQTADAISPQNDESPGEKSWGDIMGQPDNDAEESKPTGGEASPEAADATPSSKEAEKKKKKDKKSKSKKKSSKKEPKKAGDDEGDFEDESESGEAASKPLEGAGDTALFSLISGK